MFAETLANENVTKAMSSPKKQQVAVEVAAVEDKKEPISPNLKVFTFEHLRTATRNFRPDTILGEGGFGQVFKGWVDPKTYAPAKAGVGIPIAVKKSTPDSPQGLQEWQVKIDFFSLFFVVTL